MSPVISGNYKECTQAVLQVMRGLSFASDAYKIRRVTILDRKDN